MSFFWHNITREKKDCIERTKKLGQTGSRFLILDNSDYEEKVKHQTNRNSFQKISENPNKINEKKHLDRKMVQQ